MSTAPDPFANRVRPVPGDTFVQSGTPYQILDEAADGSCFYVQARYRKSKLKLPIEPRTPTELAALPFASRSWGEPDETSTTIDPPPDGGPT